MRKPMMSCTSSARLFCRNTCGKEGTGSIHAEVVRLQAASSNVACGEFENLQDCRRLRVMD